MALARAASVKGAPAEQPPPAAEDQQNPSAAEVAALAALAAWLTTTTVTAAAAPVVLSASAVGVIGALLPTPPVAVPRHILRLLAGLGVAATAARAAAGIATRAPLPVPTGATARYRTASGEPWRRAAYLLGASRRITTALTAPGGQSRAAALADAVQVEQRYWRQHLDAAARRAEAADRVDTAARSTGRFRWVTRGDSRVTPDCRRLNRRVFPVDRPPDGLYPGQMHGQCRCYAVPA